MPVPTRLARWFARTSDCGRPARRYRPLLETLEDRRLLASTITAAFGAGPGGGPQVTVVFDDNTTTSFMAFNPSFTGGVSAVLGHVTGSSVPDVIVGAGRGAGSSVAVFSGTQLVAGNVVPIASFLAFPAGFTGGVTLAAGPVNGTPHDDVIVGAGPGGGPQVVVYDGAQLTIGNPVVTASFMAFNPSFTGGVTLATGHVKGTSHADVIAGAGPGGTPGVAVFDGSQLAQGKAVASATFLAFDHAFSGGVMVATGKVNGTSHDDVIAAAGPGGGPQIQVFDGSQLAQGKATATASFMAFNPAFTGGVSIGVGHLSGNDANADVAVGAGPGGGPQVVIFNGADLAKGQPVAASTFLAFDAGFTGGVEVGVAHNATTGQDILITVAGPGGGPQVNFFNPTVFVVNNFVPYYSFFAFPFLFTGGLAFGPYFSPFFYSPLYSPFFLPGNFYGGWFADPFLTDSAFFDPTFDPGFFDPGFMDPGLFDPGFMDPGFFDPGFGGFDPGFSDFGGFDFGGFDGGF